MKNKFRIIIPTILLLTINTNIYAKFSQLHTHIITEQLQTNTYSWTIDEVEPFKELVMSWNTLRPTKGFYSFYVSIKLSETDGWSKQFKMFEWGPTFQQSITNKQSPYTYTEEDTLNVLKECYGIGFKVTVVAEDGATLDQLSALFVNTANLKHYKLEAVPSTLESVYIDGVPGKSQRILDHPRCNDVCSPISASTVINYFKLLKGDNNLINPVIFSDKVRDDENDIYGNWSLCVAEAHNASNGTVLCAATRLDDFEELHSHLMKGCPVVVSVKDPTDGIKYKSSHLMAVIGWDQENQKVICLNSAFYSDDEVEFAYDLEDFLKAWSIRRKNTAYIFYPLG